MAPNPKHSAKKKDERQLNRRKGLKMNQWREDRMKAAIDEYKNQAESGKKLALRLLSRKWNVPKTTLQRRVKGLVEGSEHASGRKPFIPIESERELARTLTLLSERGFLLRKTDVQSLAFEFAKINGIRGFSEEKQKAGHYWFEGFMKRNPGLKIKKAEVISPASTRNEKELGKWFKMYEITLDSLGIKDVSSHIWKCDLSELQDNSLHIRTEEETAVSTVLAAFNASGTFAPPLIIFKGNIGQSEWQNEEMCMRVSDNGWITAEFFIEWGKMFVARLPKDDARPHLLLLSSQNSHVFSLNFLNLMKQNNVEVMCHPTLQLANRDVFKSLKHNWCEVSGKWNHHPSTKLPKAHYRTVFMEAWKKTATMERAQDGFRIMGMFPINQIAFIEHEFLPVSRLGSDTAPIEDEAHCSTESGSDEQSIEDCEDMQKSNRHINTPGAKTIPYFQKNTEQRLNDDHLKQNRMTNSYNCSGCLIKHGTDGDPKACEAWIRCSNCKACYHESCAEDSGIYEWVYDHL